MVDIILKYEHSELVKDVPFEARWFIYFSIEKSFGENLGMLEEYLKVWNIENPNAKTYFSKAIEKGDKTYFAITIEFDYPTYLNDEIVNTLIEETKQNFATFFNQKIIELKLGPFF
jgi:GH43 family beta-xylosidase